MRKYEMTYLISDEVEEGNLNKVTGKIAGYIADAEGKIKKEDVWGRRKLAYPIKKEDFATYVTINFELPQDKVKGLEEDIKHTKGILRHMMIVRDYGDEIITLTKDEIANTEDIEKVVGGEKSFEAIEGETDESKDLMAKREEKEEKETTEQVEDKSKDVVEEKTPEKAEKIEKKAPEKKKTATAKKDKDSNEEVERLSKLNEELDDILKDEL